MSDHPVSREIAAHPPAPADENAVHLERELRETRERLQSLIEEYETALEELKSSNEELVSVNEELQSTNEELEASKEELQSVNEELHTVNSELQAKVEQLDRANSDLTNLFETTRVATIFLDSKLIIRSFTPAISQIFSILPSDRGRPLTDLVSRVAMPDLTSDVRTVFQTGKTIERTLDHNQGQAHYLLRLVPYVDGGPEDRGRRPDPGRHHLADQRRGPAEGADRRAEPSREEHADGRHGRRRADHPHQRRPQGLQGPLPRPPACHGEIL
jgi:two-component system CheB/CheR fusion protein